MERNTGILLAVSLVVLNCGYCDAKDAKPILEEFKKDYSSISEACKAVGFVRDACSTQVDQRKVAFTASVVSSSSSWNSGTLVFNKVISNVGKGYDPKTGVFTAPIAGMYVFYVAAIEYGTQHLRSDIVINNVPKVRMLGYITAGYQTGTNMVVQYLKRGDNVRVAHFQGSGYYSENAPMTTFTGFMI
ncbi:complement C1q tumor necrosis factor-related protein 3-like [Crassostrea virginica]|mmetsp:Transcript_44203/g.70657  ORF Transcript_44203/g.70657 Transcript_44203/m.70657 type:complete len:188 (-) Transcript_44203:17-580(-)